VEGGWLAIKPPPGSFSWINTRLVSQSQHDPKVFTVSAGDARVPLLLGSAIRPEKPTVEGAKVRSGTLLRSIGPKRLDDDGYWRRVEPPATEVRYIRADVVAKKGSEAPGAPPAGLPSAEPPGAPVSPPSGPPGFNEPTASATPPSPAPANGTHPLWTQA